MAILLKTISDSRQAQQDLAKLNESVGKIQTTADKTTKTVRNMATAFTVGVTAIAGGRGLMQVSDELTNIRNKMRVATDSTGQFTYGLRQVKKIALETRTSMAAVATLYSRTSLAAKQLGASQKDVAKFTRLVSMATAQSGTTTQESTNALIQLAQALQSGQLRGDELRSVMENAGMITKQIAEGMGVSIGMLREMAEKGDLSAKRVFDAILRRQDAIEKNNGKMEISFGMAFQNLRSAALMAFEAINKALFGATTSLAEMINNFAKGLGDFALNAEHILFRLKVKFLTFVAEVLGMGEMLWGGLSQGAEKAAAYITGLFAPIAKAVEAAFGAAKIDVMAYFPNMEKAAGYVKGWAERVGKYFYDLYDDVIGHSYIPDLVGGVQKWMAKLRESPLAAVKDFASKASSAFARMKFILPSAVGLGVLARYSSALRIILGLVASIGAAWAGVEWFKAKRAQEKVREENIKNAVRRPGVDGSISMAEDIKRQNRLRVEQTKASLEPIESVKKSTAEAARQGKATGDRIAQKIEEGTKKTTQAILASRLMSWIGAGKKSFDESKLGHFAKQILGLRDTTPGYIWDKDRPIDTGAWVGQGPQKSMKRRFPGHDFINALPGSAQLPVMMGITGLFILGIRGAFKDPMTRRVMISGLTTVMAIAAAQTIYDSQLRESVFGMFNGAIKLALKPINSLYSSAPSERPNRLHGNGPSPKLPVVQNVIERVVGFFKNIDKRVEAGKKAMGSAVTSGASIVKLGFKAARDQIAWFGGRGGSVLNDPLGFLGLVAKSALIFSKGRELIGDALVKTLTAPTALGASLGNEIAANRAEALTRARGMELAGVENRLKADAALSRRNYEAQLARYAAAYTGNDMRRALNDVQMGTNRQGLTPAEIREITALRASRATVERTDEVAKNMRLDSGYRDISGRYEDQKKISDKLRQDIGDRRQNLINGIRSFSGGAGGVLFGAAGLQIGSQIAEGMAKSPAWEKAMVIAGTSFAAQAFGAAMFSAIAAIMTAYIVPILIGTAVVMGGLLAFHMRDGLMDWFKGGFLPNFQEPDVMTGEERKQVVKVSDELEKRGNGGPVEDFGEELYWESWKIRMEGIAQRADAWFRTDTKFLAGIESWMPKPVEQPQGYGDWMKNAGYTLWDTVKIPLRPLSHLFSDAMPMTGGAKEWYDSVAAKEAALQKKVEFGQQLLGLDPGTFERFNGQFERYTELCEQSNDALSGVPANIVEFGNALDVATGRLNELGDKIIRELEQQRFEKNKQTPMFTGVPGAFNFYNNAEVKDRKYGGGWIKGPGSGTSDSILASSPIGPIKVSNGEFLVNAKAAEEHRALLEAINGGADIPGFASGGGPRRSSTGPSRPYFFQPKVSTIQAPPQAPVVIDTIGGNKIGPGGPSTRKQIMMREISEIENSVMPKLAALGLAKIQSPATAMQMVRKAGLMPQVTRYQRLLMNLQYMNMMEDVRANPDNFIKGYRGGKEGGVETMPTYFRKDKLAESLHVIKWLKEKGYPTPDAKDWAAIALKEGREDLGSNFGDLHNERLFSLAASFIEEHSNGGKYDGLLDSASLASDLAVLVVDKMDASKRLGVPFARAWNGMGVNAFGQSGEKYAADVARYKESVLSDPKNAELLEFFEKGVAGELPKFADGGSLEDLRAKYAANLQERATELRKLYSGIYLVPTEGWDGAKFKASPGGKMRIQGPSLELPKTVGELEGAYALWLHEFGHAGDIVPDLVKAGYGSNPEANAAAIDRVMHGRHIFASEAEATMAAISDKSMPKSGRAVLAASMRTYIPRLIGAGVSDKDGVDRSADIAKGIDFIDDALVNGSVSSKAMDDILNAAGIPKMIGAEDGDYFSHEIWSVANKQLKGLQLNPDYAAVQPFLGIFAQDDVKKKGIPQRNYWSADGYATGGWISGPGTGTSDSILAFAEGGPIKVSDGEFIVRASAAKRHKDLLEAINSGARLPGFAGGTPSTGGGAPLLLDPVFQARWEELGKTAKGLNGIFEKLAYIMKYLFDLILDETKTREDKIAFAKSALSTAVQPILDGLKNGMPKAPESKTPLLDKLRTKSDEKQKDALGELAKFASEKGKIKGLGVPEIAEIEPDVVAQLMQDLDSVNQMRKQVGGTYYGDKFLAQLERELSAKIANAVDAAQEAGKIPNADASAVPDKDKGKKQSFDSFGLIQQMLPDLGLSLERYLKLPNKIAVDLYKAAERLASAQTAVEGMADPSKRREMEVALDRNRRIATRSQAAVIAPFRTRMENAAPMMEKAGVEVNNAAMMAMLPAEYERLRDVVADIVVDQTDLSDKLNLSTEERLKIYQQMVDKQKEAAKIAEQAERRTKTITQNVSEDFAKIGANVTPDMQARMGSKRVELAGRSEELAKWQSNIDSLNNQGQKEGNREKVALAQEQQAQLDKQREALFEEIAKYSDDYKSSSEQAGEAFASSINSGFKDGLKGLMKGDLNGKDFLAGVLDTFTNSVIDNFVEGLTEPFMGEKGIVTTVMKDLGGSIWGLGGGKDGEAKGEDRGAMYGGTPVEPKGIKDLWSTFRGEKRGKYYGDVPGISAGIGGETPAAPIGDFSGTYDYIGSVEKSRFGSAGADFSPLSGGQVATGMGGPLSVPGFNPLSGPVGMPPGVGGTFLPPGLGAPGACPVGGAMGGAGSPLGGLLAGAGGAGAGADPGSTIAGPIVQAVTQTGDKQIGALGGLGDSLGGALGGLMGKLGGGGGGGGFGGFGGGWGALAGMAVSFLSKADGGPISGPGTGTSDSIPTMLSNGEFVINARSTKAYAPVLKAINDSKGRVRKFAEGGMVATGPSPSVSSSGSQELSKMGASRNQTAFNISITGDVSRQTRSEMIKMIPSLAEGVNGYNREKGNKSK